MRRNPPSSSPRSSGSMGWMRLAATGLLALALALAQQHAVLHWLSHALAQTAAVDKAAAASAHCGDCDAVASFGAAAPTADQTPSFRIDAEVPVADRAAVRGGAALCLAYRSRAPPSAGLT